MSDVDARAKAIFFEALDCATPEQLIAHLEKACGGDLELRGRVADLLRAIAQRGGDPRVLRSSVTEDASCGSTLSDSRPFNMGTIPLDNQQE